MGSSKTPLLGFLQASGVSEDPVRSIFTNGVYEDPVCDYPWMGLVRIPCTETPLAELLRILCAETPLGEFLRILCEETPLAEFFEDPGCSDTPPCLLGNMVIGAPDARRQNKLDF